MENDRISILIHEIFYSLLLISSNEKIVEKLWGGIRRFLIIFHFDYFIDGYILNDLQIVARCARSAALIRASGAGARMVTSD